MISFDALAGIDLDDAAARCVDVGLAMAKTLRGSCSREAETLLNEGFLIPSLATLEMIAEIIEDQFDRTGGPYMDPGTGLRNLIALGSIVRNVPDTVDLAWSSSWQSEIARYRDVIELAEGVLVQYGLGRGDDIARMIERDRIAKR